MAIVHELCMPRVGFLDVERIDVLRFWRMSHTITVRLTKDLAAWLEETASRSGRSQGQIVRDELNRARASKGDRSFMNLAGKVTGPADLSKRKGFSRK